MADDSERLGSRRAFLASAGGLGVGAIAGSAHESSVDSVTNPIADVASREQGTEPESVVASGGLLAVAALYDSPRDIAAPFTPPFPAGMKVLLNAQTDPAEDGWYLSDGAKGVVGPPTPVKSLANYVGGLVVVAQRAYTDVRSSPAAALYDVNGLPPDQNAVDVRQLTTMDGIDFTLTPQGLPPQTLLDMSGRAWSPMMNDFGGINSDLSLTLNHHIVSCNPSSPITITLAPHATKPRHCYVMVHPDSAGTVTLVNHPTDLEFSYELGAGERCLILPDQAEWIVWPMGPALRQRTVDSDTRLLVWDRVVGVDTSLRTITIDTSEVAGWPGLEVTVDNIGDGTNDVVLTGTISRRVSPRIPAGESRTIFSGTEGLRFH